jgi:hypothetical protein
MPEHPFAFPVNRNRPNTRRANNSSKGKKATLTKPSLLRRLTMRLTRKTPRPTIITPNNFGYLARQPSPKFKL